MELIGRVAWQFFINSDQASMPLEDKVCFVLDEWLTLVGVEREEAQPYEEGVFEESNSSEDENQLVIKRYKLQHMPSMVAAE